MRLLSRYLVRSLLAPFVFALVALTCMLLLNHISKALPDLVGKGLAPQVILEALTLSLPFIVALTMPMAVLVAVIYGFSQLAAESEITAMKANGVSVSQLLRPVFVAGVVIALTNFFFVDQVLPRSNARLKALRVDIARKKPTVALRVEAINDLPPSAYYLRASRIEAETGGLRDVILFDLGQAMGRRIIVADSGTLAFETQGEHMVMTLYEGRVHDYDRTNPGVVEVTDFVTNTILVRNVANSLQRSDGQFEFGEREKSSCEMLDEVVWAGRRQAQYHERLQRLGFHDLRVLLDRRQPDLAPVRLDTTSVNRCGPWARVDEVMRRVMLPAPLEAQEAAAAAVSAAPDVRSLDQDPQPPTPLPVPETPQAEVPPTAPVAESEFDVPQLTMMGELAFLRSQHDEAVSSAYRYQVEIHKKFSISFACLNFVIIGIALALRFPRGGVGLVMGGSVPIFAVFYVSLTAGESFADFGQVSPALVMWLPNLVIFTAGAIGLARVSRYSGSTRGGDLSELAEIVLGWLPFRRRRPA